MYGRHGGRGEFKVLEEVRLELLGRVEDLCLFESGVIVGRDSSMKGLG